METVDNNNEASIEAIRKDGVLCSVKLIMPAWEKVIEDGTTEVNLPLLGISTSSSGSADSEAAFEEAVKIFCIAAEKFGEGLDAELTDLGWKLEQDTQKSHIFNVSDGPFVEELMKTGDPMALELELTC